MSWTQCFGVSVCVRVQKRGVLRVLWLYWLFWAGRQLSFHSFFQMGPGETAFTKFPFYPLSYILVIGIVFHKSRSSDLRPCLRSTCLFWQSSTAYIMATMNTQSNFNLIHNILLLIINVLCRWTSMTMMSNGSKDATLLQKLDSQVRVKLFSTLDSIVRAVNQVI